MWNDTRGVRAMPVAVLGLILLAGSSGRTQTPRRTPEPIVVDVRGNGYSLTSVTDGVRFDLDGDGVAEQWAWTAAGSDDAFLAMDENHNGLVDDGRELLAGVSGPPNGFGALNAYDGFASPRDLSSGSNRRPDGLLTNADAIFGRLLLWTDVNHNGVSEEDELESLAHAGITTIYLGIKDISRYDPYGNLLHYQSSAQLVNKAGVSVLRPVTSIALLRSVR